MPSLFSMTLHKDWIAWHHGQILYEGTQKILSAWSRMTVSSWAARCSKGAISLRNGKPQPDLLNSM